MKEHTFFAGPTRLQLVLTAAAIAAAVPVIIGAVPALGQSSAVPPVIVALPDAFPTTRIPGTPKDNVLAVTLRGPERPDIIVLNGEYTAPAGLAAASRALERSRAAAPHPNRSAVLVLRIAQLPETSRASFPRIARALARLRRQPRSRIGNLGLGRWFEFPAEALGLGHAQ